MGSRNIRFNILMIHIANKSKTKVTRTNETSTALIIAIELKLQNGVVKIVEDAHKVFECDVLVVTEEGLQCRRILCVLREVTIRAGVEGIEKVTRLASKRVLRAQDLQQFNQLGTIDETTQVFVEHTKGNLKVCAWDTQQGDKQKVFAKVNESVLIDIDLLEELGRLLFHTGDFTFGTMIKGKKCRTQVIQCHKVLAVHMNRCKSRKHLFGCAERTNAVVVVTADAFTPVERFAGRRHFRGGIG
mmetsp:Transcript_25621/g.64302  ORF Transcript_25621/g.64302 Transcript_25621/m.64302 type:complete len:244 (+) Transcript_25621:429-1160(+)